MKEEKPKMLINQPIMHLREGISKTTSACNLTMRLKKKVCETPQKIQRGGIHYMNAPKINLATINHINDA